MAAGRKGKTGTRGKSAQGGLSPGAGYVAGGLLAAGALAGGYALWRRRAAKAAAAEALKLESDGKRAEKQQLEEKLSKLDKDIANLQNAISPAGSTALYQIIDPNLHKTISSLHELKEQRKKLASEIAKLSF